MNAANLFRTAIYARCFSLLFVAFIAAGSALATPQLDAKIRELMAERHIPGAAVAVVKAGRVVKIKAYGLASLEFEVPVTTDTVFEIGSVSKQMTAAGIMLLVQDGKVGLDERISRYLPNTPDAWKDVTVRHLLAHTSGIKSYSSLEGFELSHRMSVDDFIKKLSPHPLEFTPGERNIYSNSGYNLLAFIIETQSGKQYLDFMRERIFLPLGMTRTGDRDPQYIIKQRAAGYEWRDNSHSGRDGSLTDLTGAGSITSTIADMVKWEAALRGERLLNADSKKQSWSQFTFNSGQLSPYGLGWRISDVRKHKLIAHSGQTAGFGAAIHRYVDSDVSVIALTNLGESGMGTLVAVTAAKAYIPTLPLSAVTTEVTLDEKVRSAVESGLRIRFSGTSTGTIFSERMALSFNSERSKALGARIRKFAPIISFRHIGFDNQLGRQVATTIVKTARRTFLFRTTIDDKGSITAIDLDEEDL